MKKSIIIFTIAISAFASRAQTQAGPTRQAAKAAEMSEEEAEARMQARLKRVGGLVMKPGKGSVAVFDYQGRLPERHISDFFMLTEKAPIRVPFKRVKRGEEAFSLANASAILAKDGSCSGIFIIEDASLPMTLVAMEARWGVLNVAPLLADKPSAALLARRADKLFTRVCTVVLGGANQDVPFSAMKTITTLGELDKMSAFAVAPMGLQMMNDHLEKIGVEFPYLTTYKKACREGWAPAPTNDIQKAVWEKVKADKERGPTNPIIIPPPNAKK